MAFLQDKINRFSISDNAKSVLTSCWVNESRSVLRDPYCEALFKTMLRELKADKSMLGFLMRLVDDPDDRYIKLPYYLLTKKRKLKPNEMVLDEYGKYGILLNVVSNKKSFNFSVRLKDMTIVKFNYELKKQERGSFRSFTLTDKFGNIGEMWKTLKVFQMHETKKIFDNHDKHEHVVFSNFVNDEIGKQLFNIKYLLLRCYINRLVRERDYWKQLQEKAVERIKTFDCDYEVNLIKQELSEQEGED